MHSNIDLAIRSRILSYNVTTQSLAERSVVRDSDYHELKLAAEILSLFSVPS